jgi:hypothetical protein
LLNCAPGGLKFNIELQDFAAAYRMIGARPPQLIESEVNEPRDEEDD